MNTITTRTTTFLICLLLVAGCGGKKAVDDSDAENDVTPDGTDVTTDTDIPDGEDVPGDNPSDVIEEDVPLPTPDFALKYLGRYEHQDDGPDHLLGTAFLDEDRLLVASATGVAVVDRAAVQSGTVTSHMGKYMTDTSTPSNLDGAPTSTTYFPMFHDIAVSGSTAYATTRYEGLYVFDVSGSGTSWTVSEIGTHLRAREFTENVHIQGDRMYLTHHADGIEVMDIGTDPQNPTTISTLSENIVDAWGIAASDDGKVWVADGAGGVKLVRVISDTLTYITGDTLTTSPGTALDVALQGDWVVAAMGGKGISVYEQWTAALRNTYPLPGVCVDVEPLGDDRFAVACRSWIHVVDIDPLGIAKIIASARLHRRLDGSNASVHIGSRVRADGDTLYVSGWDHVDVYRLVDTDTDPDIQIDGQRAHFGTPPGNRTFEVKNGGFGMLTVSSVDCTEPSLTCTLDSMSVAPGEATTLRIVFDGSATDVQALVTIQSNDPEDGTLPIMVFAALDGIVDPLETAPDFSGSTSLYDYTAGTFTDGTLTLSDFDTAGEVVHFAIFGSW
jgi:hypothetical protein